MTTALQPRQVKAIHGWLWIKEGFGLFRKSPLLWVVLFAISVFGALLLAQLPFVGSLLVELLSPVLLAGFMHGCRALETGEDLEIGHLAAGLKTGAAQLVTVGGVYLLGIIVVNYLIYFMGGDNIARLGDLTSQQSPDPEAVRQVMAQLALPFSVGLLLVVPLAMATWFAPALIAFNRVGALEAMKLSLRGCLANVMPFLVYGLVTFALTILALIPMTLGLLVLGPILIGSFYAGYKDVFAVSAAGE